MLYHMRTVNQDPQKSPKVQLCFPTAASDFLDLLYKVKWIKHWQNRQHPADPPAELRAYLDYLYEIPQEYQHQLIPEPTFNIIKFTELKLPGTTSTSIEYTAKNRFLEHKP